MNKEKRQAIINNIINVTENKFTLFDITSHEFVRKLCRLHSSDAFKILFELMDIARTIENKDHRYNIYSYICLALASCIFNEKMSKLLYKRIFFNIELLDFLYFFRGNTLNWSEINDYVGKDKMCMKTLSKFILKHKKHLFDLSKIILAFKYNLDDNIIDCILNILLKYVDKTEINDFNLGGFINCNRRFTEKQCEKINAIKILCAINN